MPRFDNAVYFKVHQGEIVGLEDYIYNLSTEGVIFEEDKAIRLDLFEADDYGRRRFNVRISGESTCFKLNIFEFQKLMIEFPDFAELLIKMQFKQLQALLDAKV